MLSTNQFIFLPLLVQIALTLTVFFRLAAAKSRASKEGTVDLERRALHADAWPDFVQQINNNIRNQFEVPVLFYVMVLMLYVLEAAGFWAQLTAWLFVLSRIAHAYIHTGSNHIPLRRPVFMFGCIMLIAMLGLASFAVIA